jgi:hypothetical protein
MDGSLDPNGLMLTVQNHTGNKLDWFVRPAMDLSVEQRPGGWRRVHLRIRIANPTPLGQPAYIAGDGNLVAPGAERALVAVYLPGWATNVEMPGHTVLIGGRDGRMRVVGTRVDIARAAIVVIDVTFDAPPGARDIVLLPSGRPHPVPLVDGKARFNDATPVEVAM